MYFVLCVCVPSEIQFEINICTVLSMITCFPNGDIVTLEHKKEHNIGWYVQDATRDYICTT